MTKSIDGQHVWTHLAERLVDAHQDVAHGRMMSAPAVTCGGKVFAFYSGKEGMQGLGIRLGRDYDIDSLGLTDWAYLAPFKTKPPMKDWIIVGSGQADRWADLSEIALDLMRKK